MVGDDQSTGGNALKEAVREAVESELGADVGLELVADGDRVDVRVTDLGVEEVLESELDDVSISRYGDYRLTVMRE